LPVFDTDSKERERERESLFTKYITQIIHINCYIGRLPVEA